MKCVRAIVAILLLQAVFSLTALAQPSSAHAAERERAVAIFAGGCFWCMEADFEKLPGVREVESGYIGGDLANPTYEQVSAGNTGHAEAVRVHYDPSRVSYAQLLDHFWRNIDPTVDDRQFCDVGSQYRSGIFYLNEAQKRAALESRNTLQQSSGLPAIKTEITAAGPFYPAEEYHQDYYKKNPLRYKFYRYGCGRDARLAELWPSKD